MKKKYKQFKYKSLLRLRDVFYSKKRLLNFKRPKWASIKKIFFFKFVKRKNVHKIKQIYKYKFFQNQFVYYAPLKWTYLKSFYRTSLLAKLRLLHFFSLKIPLKSLKKYSADNILVQIESRLDVILWRSGFFESPAVARFFINHKNIYLNDKLLNLSNYLLSEGDIILVKGPARFYIINRFLVNKVNQTKKNQIFIEKVKLIYPIASYLETNLNTFEIIYLQKYAKVFKSPFLYNTNLNLPALNYYLKQS